MLQSTGLQSWNERLNMHTHPMYVCMYVCVCVCVCVYIYIVFQFLFPCRLLQSIEFLVLYIKFLSITNFIYSSVYILIPTS